MADVEDAGHVGVDDTGPLLGGHLGDRHERADARVVHHDVEAAEASLRLRDGCGHRRIVAHVDDDGVHLTGCPLQALFRRLQIRGTAAGDDHVHAPRDQRLSDAESDAFRAAGDERDLSAQFLFHGCPYNSPHP